MKWIEKVPAKQFVRKRECRCSHDPGDTPLPEYTLSHWEGYRGSWSRAPSVSPPLRSSSRCYGELRTRHLYNKYVSPISYDMWVRIRSRLEWLCENWQRPDAGIWEMRNRQEHFIYSKVMNWVALDRGARLADKRALPADRAKWIHERDRIYEEVMTRGWK